MPFRNWRVRVFLIKGARLCYSQYRILCKVTLDTASDSPLTLFGRFLNVLINFDVISRTDPKTELLTILRAATHETELGDHDFCLSRSHYSYTDPTSRESNPGPPHQESRALPTELPRPLPLTRLAICPLHCNSFYFFLLIYYTIL